MEERQSKPNKYVNENPKEENKIRAELIFQNVIQENSSEIMKD